MRTKILCFLTLTIAIVLSQKCTNKDVLNIYGRSLHDFSVALLSRVSDEKKGHFVFSPLATWLQLVTLAEGSSGKTLREIKNSTGLTRGTFRLCYKRIIRNILKDLYHDLSESKHSSLIIIDKFYNVKQTYKTRVSMIDNVKILSLNFDDNDESADIVNDVIKQDTEDITDAVNAEYFNYSTLLFIHATNFKSKWRYPFNPIHTELSPFFSEEGASIGHVNMMKITNSLNYTEIPLINSRILELPLENDRVSMLIFLPIKKNESINDLYHAMMHMNIKGIFNIFANEKEKAVEVNLPRFTIETDMDDMRYLLYDMGVHRAFYPSKAELKGISKYSLSASFISQTAKIEVTEEYVSADVVEMVAEESDVIKFNANRPFGFMLVDRITKFILFGGMYTVPGVY